MFTFVVLVQPHAAWLPCAVVVDCDDGSMLDVGRNRFNEVSLLF